MKAVLALLAALSLACGRPYSVRRGVVYARSCSEALTLDAYVPDGAGPFPAVVLIHGGGWSARRPRDMAHIARALARRGFVALTIVYRLAPANRYPAALEDVLEAVRYARRESAVLKLDPERLGAWGYSAGAHLAAMLGVGGGEDSGPGDRVAAVVAGGVPADFSKYPLSPIITPFLGPSFAEDPALWREASPVGYATPDDAAFFLYHGTADTLVEPEQARLLAEALTRAGVACRVFWVEGRGHVSAFVFDGGAVAAALDFLETALAAPRPG